MADVRNQTVPPPPEDKDKTDFSRPPTGHHPGEGPEAERSKTQGPDHMREELNPTVGGAPQENRGQERRQGERRRTPSR